MFTRQGWAGNRDLGVRRASVELRMRWPRERVDSEGEAEEVCLGQRNPCLPGWAEEAESARAVGRTCGKKQAPGECVPVVAEVESISRQEGPGRSNAAGRSN